MSNCDIRCPKVISGRISPMVLVCAVHRRLEIFNISHINEIGLFVILSSFLSTNPMTGHSSFPMVGESFASAANWYINIEEKHWPVIKCLSTLFSKRDFASFSLTFGEFR